MSFQFMAKKQKFYVVWEGHMPGIYNNWNECKAQTQNYPGAKYKAYASREEAEDAFVSGPEFTGGTKQRKSATKSFLKEDLSLPAWAVDAACSGNPGVMEYRGVEIETGTEIFKMGPFEDGTNNIGEFLALVHALALLKKEGKHHVSIYSDSKIAMLWVSKKHCNTKLLRTNKNTTWLSLIQRAEHWLKNNSYSNRILKWDTRNWGEIPADFGRK